jgi:hypothetical protein
MKFWVIFLLVFLLEFCNGETTLAGELANRLEKYPQWEKRPSLKIAQGDLIYPDWMEGTWEVTSTLIDLVAPFAPEIVTPGFEGNYRYLNRPIAFQVKFLRRFVPNTRTIPVILVNQKLPVVADRAFNGLRIAQSYLGKKAVLSVKVDPENPNRQITFLPQERQLISTVTARESESEEERFISSEITQQVFRGNLKPYLNEVETTTAYQLLKTRKIEANQVTAIYLSPQDPDYFKVSDRPIALYRYQLELVRSLQVTAEVFNGSE